MRSKEDAHDYRYFPDPDLLPLTIGEEWIERVRASLPELPGAMRERFQRDLRLPDYDAALLTASRELATYFEAAARALPAEAKLVANWVIGELSGRLNKDGLEIGQSPLGPSDLAALLRRVADGTLSGKLAREVFDALWSGERDVDRIIQSRGLRQISDTGAIERVVDGVIAANAQQVADYRAGKEKAFNFLVGQIMKGTQGKANPVQVSEVLRRKLSN